MKKVLTAALLACVGFAAAAQERYAGLHFDFHATLMDTTIGRTMSYGLVDSLIRQVKPDFIQVDCKGHDGVSSYPTKAGNSLGKFEGDILRIWREATAAHNIPLYVHYSGLWDNRALQLHPEWARRHSDGSPDKQTVSMKGPYLKELMIPQLKELITDYGVDGIWVDGDCWMLQTDYSPAMVEGFRKETGLADAPRDKDDPAYVKWMEYNRKKFREYITEYAEAAHGVKASFQVASNWSFSSMMPEPVDVPVDFLSGDVAGSNSLYSAAFESRCLASQGKPWDLMSWSFAWRDPLKGNKSVMQLKQEAAQVIAMGGGFQTYWQQNRDGSPEPYHFDKMAEIIAFSQERKAYGFGSQAVPQVGLLYSTYAWKRIPNDRLYGSYGQQALKGTLNMLLDGQLATEILMDHHLEGRLRDYPLLVLPEWKEIDSRQRQQIMDYVQEGGMLIVTGAEAAQSFAELLGIRELGGVQQDTLFFAGLPGENILRLKTSFLPVEPERGTHTFGTQLKADDWRFTAEHPLATWRPMGKGKIAAIYLDMGDFYTRHKNPLLPALLKGLIREMGVELLVEVEASSLVHQVVARKNSKLYVHLINTSGPHDNPQVLVYEEVPPIRNLRVQVQSTRRPSHLRLLPEGETLPFEYRDGKVIVEIPELKVHSILELEGL